MWEKQGVRCKVVIKKTAKKKIVQKINLKSMVLATMLLSLYVILTNVYTDVKRYPTYVVMLKQVAVRYVE